MRLLIEGGTLVTPEAVLPNHSLFIEDGRIIFLEAGRRTDDGEWFRVNAAGMWVVPGLIDIHVHGAAGYEVMDATEQALHSMANFFAQHGVTSYLATTISASFESTLAAVENVSRTNQPPKGSRHLGVHLEGPYINPKFGGAQPPQQIRNPNLNEFESWLSSGSVRMVTVAPELPGALQIIDRGVRDGIQFAVGHSMASHDQLLLAIGRGLHHATHTFNAMQAMNHRDPGVVGGVLTDDRIWAQLICDGVHVHPAVIKLLFRAKGVKRTVLITDAIGAAGLSDGNYSQLGQSIVVTNGIAKTAEGRLAGSTLTLDKALRNMMSYCDLSLVQALPMVTSVPAESLGIAARKGSLHPGSDADVVLLDSNLNVRLTIVAGHIVYQANECDNFRN